MEEVLENKTNIEIEKRKIEAEKRKEALAKEDVGKLLFKFAIPSIIGMFVGALYNIVDQIFIGQGVGMLGNVATNVSFPIITITLGFGLLIGIGAAANFNLTLGKGDEKNAAKFIGNAVLMMSVIGILIATITILFLEKLLILFGATEQVMPYAKTYLGIIAYGIPLQIVILSGSHIIRADGSPKTSMIITLVGAILNTILDPIFIFKFNLGIAGAAWATVISQFVSAVLVINYIRNYKTVRLLKEHFVFEMFFVLNIIRLGSAAFFNQILQSFVQIVFNNVIRHYGALSQYGADIPLASIGIISKVSLLVFAISIGIAQGMQPIVSFNYGAKNYDRVKGVLKVGIIASIVASTIGFLVFELFPRQVIGFFGVGSDEYFNFAVKSLRIIMIMLSVNGIQILSGQFFTSIGKARKGLFISLTRQFIFLIPLIILLPRFFGIDGIVYAAPITDLVTFIVCVVFLIKENAEFKKLEHSV